MYLVCRHAMLPSALHDALPIFHFKVPHVDQEFRIQFLGIDQVKERPLRIRVGGDRAPHDPFAVREFHAGDPSVRARDPVDVGVGPEDRKSTRLNSSHRCISYAVTLCYRLPYTTLFRSFISKFRTWTKNSGSSSSGSIR